MYQIIILSDGEQIGKVLAYDDETKNSATRFYNALGYETEILKR